MRENLNNNIEIKKLRYKGRRMQIYYCNCNNFEWYAANAEGELFICINKNLDNKARSIVFHRVLKNINSINLNKHISINIFR